MSSAISGRCLAELTWEEIRERANADAVAVLPTGSMEQHGPHLSVNVDTVLVTAVAEEAVRRVHSQINVVLAPTLWVGLSTHHSAYFSLTLSFDTYQRVLDELVESLVRAGFTRILIVNGHGGNSDALGVVVSKIRDRHKVVVATADYWALAADAIAEIRESGPGGTGHACEFETSCMMHLEARLVRADRIQAEYPPQIPGWITFDLIDGGRIKVGTRFEDITRKGVVGDPTLATPEKGRRFLEAAASGLERLLLTFATWDISEGLRARNQ